MEPDRQLPSQRRRGQERETEGFEPSDGLPWGAALHPLGAPRLLTADDPRSPSPRGFKGRLYDPQATLLHAMAALERRPLLRVDDSRSLQTRCGRVSERFSFGKTVLALALVCAQRVPARLPELAPLATCGLSAAEARRANWARVDLALGWRGCAQADAVYLPEIALRYARFLPFTVVAAAASVISQWEDNARRFTDLRWFVVENVHTLREFELRLRQGRAADCDLLFVKAGRVTANFAAAGEAPRAEKQAKNRSLLEALAHVFEGVPVARFIVDDYDTLKLGGDDCFLPALFTWLISATRRVTMAKVSIHAGATAGEFFRANSARAFPILGAAQDDILNQVCSLHCAPAYVDAHLGSTVVGFRRIRVRGGQVAAILRDLEVPANVVEMVNADAVSTAAQTLGIAADSIGDVLRRVVGSQLSSLRLAVRTSARIERVYACAAAPKAAVPEAAPEAVSEAPAPETETHVPVPEAPVPEAPVPEAPVPEALAPKAESEALALEAESGAPVPEAAHASSDRDAVSLFRALLKNGTDDAFEAALPVRVSRKLRTALASLEAWAAEQRETHGRVLSRMRDNIREGHCQCCALPFERDDAAYVLASCCQVIVCEPCITRKEASGKSFIRRCPNCASDIALRTGLVRVGAELDLEAALRDETLIAAAEAQPASETAVPEAPDAEEVASNNPKLRALLQLVRGRPIDCLQDAAVPPHIGGLLHGRRDAPWPADAPKKFLVFAVYPESTALIRAELARLGLPHCVLRGTRTQKDEAVRLLREEVGVMLVTAPKDCAGLDLPFISHVVLYHRVLDLNVEAQVAARGQRLGRAHNLEVVSLVNETEALLA